MIPAAVRGLLARNGRAVTLRRRIGSTARFNEAETVGVLRAFAPEQLVGGVMQGDARVILDAAPLADMAPPRKGDFLVVDGRTWSVQGAHARMVRDCAPAFECWVRGG